MIKKLSENARLLNDQYKANALESALRIVEKWRRPDNTEAERAFLAAALYGDLFLLDGMRNPETFGMTENEWQRMWNEMAWEDILVFHNLQSNHSDRAGAAIRMMDCLAWNLPVYIPELDRETISEMHTLKEEWNADQEEIRAIDAALGL